MTNKCGVLCCLLKWNINVFCSFETDVYQLAAMLWMMKVHCVEGCKRGMQVYNCTSIIVNFNTKHHLLNNDGYSRLIPVAILKTSDNN